MIEGRQNSRRMTWLVDNYLKDNYRQACDLIRRAQADGSVRPGDPTLLYYGLIALAGTAFSLRAEIAQVSGNADAVSPAKVEALIHAFLFEP